MTVHPGQLLREAIQLRGLTQAALAEMLGRPPQVFSDIVTGKKSITADTALDLQQGLDISAEFWVHAQAEHDLAVARQRRAAGRKM
jgi:HTH-type transcriptional regulator/antitoxin HigA